MTCPDCIYSDFATPCSVFGQCKKREIVVAAHTSCRLFVEVDFIKLLEAGNE